MRKVKWARKEERMIKREGKRIGCKGCNEGST
jgi:hypothetical protein